MNNSIHSRKILIIGSGGREHAIATKLSQSSLVSAVFVCPGNPGMLKNNSGIQIKNLAADDSIGLLNFAIEENIALTIVGPEASLSLGIVDLFVSHNRIIVGPTKAASLLETSKAYAKTVMNKAMVPTAGYSEFFDAESAINSILSSSEEKMVVKCDGLAAGKGVIVCQNKIEALQAVNALMKENLLGTNIDHIIIEEFLEGVEVSAFALCDGETFTFLGTACDHKRLRDGDLGPNTGGMGVYSPASVFSAEDELWVNEKVFAPMLKTMKEFGTPFSGILFAGLMKTNSGYKVLEFNVRFGDPETQVLLPLIKEDLLPWFMAAATGSITSLQKKLSRQNPIKLNLKGVHVVMAAFGYPGTEGVKVRAGDEIRIDQNFRLNQNEFLFYAGVAKSLINDSLVTSGGRVLGITVLNETISKARFDAYDLIQKIQFEGAQFRRDIGSGQS